MQPYDIIHSINYEKILLKVLFLYVHSETNAAKTHCKLHYVVYVNITYIHKCNSNNNPSSLTIRLDWTSISETEILFFTISCPQAFFLAFCLRI